MSSDKLKEIVSSETSAFRSQCCKIYVDAASGLGVPAKVEQAVIIVGSSPAKNYVRASCDALQQHKNVLIAGKGAFLGKAIAVAELVKQQTSGKLAQYNHASSISSLINPAFKPSASSKNIDIFLDDGDSASDSFADQSSQQTTQSSADVLREIHGHKVFKVATVAVLLVDDSSAAGRILSKWTTQHNGF